MATGRVPFRNAWIWILVMAALAVVAFWPRYFGVFTTADWRFHVHGLTATAWMLLMALQVRLAHTGKLATHRRLGMASLVIAPLFLVGAMLVIQTQGSDHGPIHQMFGPGLVGVDILGALLFAYLFASALATRRQPQLHARYMVGTLFLLIGPIGTRLLAGMVPGFTIRSLEDMPRFGPALHVANGGFVVLLCAYLYSRAPQYGRPFVIIGAVAVLQSVLLELLRDVPSWDETTLAMSQLPATPFIVAGLVLGAVAVMVGWKRAASAPRRI